MKKHYVYKCVRVLSRDTYASISPPNWRLELNYRLGVWTKAFNGTPGIFVFPTLGRAMDFTSSGLVLKCEYAGEPLRLSMRLDIYDKVRFGYKSLVSIFSTPEKRERMINRINDCGFADYACHCPYETNVVNAVKPVRISWPRGKGKLKMVLSTFAETVPFNRKLSLPEWMNNKWRIKR